MFTVPMEVCQYTIVNGSTLKIAFESFMLRYSGIPRGVFGGFKLPHPHPPKFQSFDKAKPNSQFCGKYIRNNLIRNGFHSFAN
jgi:hypothetical protein